MIPLIKAKSLGQILGFSNLWLKLENMNPTGSVKDRSAKHVSAVAAAQGYIGLTAGTCGNYGLALARCCSALGLKCTIFVPATYTGMCDAQISRWGASVIREGTTYEEAVAASAIAAIGGNLFDANPYGPAGELAIIAYSKIAEEIMRSLPVPPVSVWIPVGNGTILAGIHRGFTHIGLRPFIGAVGSLGNSAAIASVMKGEVTQLVPAAIRGSAINEPLVNWNSSHSREVLIAVRESNGFAYEVTDSMIIHFAKLLEQTEGITGHTAGAVALAGLFANREQLKPDAVHVVILTG